MSSNCNSLTDASNKPTAARRAFPCWDEPLLKATFAVTMISRTDTVNLSNMPASSEKIYQPEEQTQGTPLGKWLAGLTNEPKDKWKITKFETTPPVSLFHFLPSSM